MAYEFEEDIVDPLYKLMKVNDTCYFSLSKYNIAPLI